MAKFTIDDILNSDPLGLLGEVKAKNPIITTDDRLIASFEEINSFIEKYGYEPKRSNDMSERRLYSRLQGIREDKQKSKALKAYDRFNLLANLESEALAPNSIDDILDSDIFELLEDDEVDIFTLKHIPKIKREESDFVAKRRVCKDFEKYEELFKLCQADLKLKKRKLVKFNERYLEEGSFFVLRGLLGYLVKKDIHKSKFNKMDGRILAIFENGTESNMLFRSLGKGLYEDGYLVTELEDRVLDRLSGVTQQDKQNGYIYILKSKSQDDRIITKRNLYKIGFSSNDITERIKNAKNEPTYLMADVEVVAIYECFNMNSQKLEQLLHKFFGESCLDIEIFDKEGKSHYPREWFIAPLDVIDEVIGLVLSGEIVNYRYDVESESII